MSHAPHKIEACLRCIWVMFHIYIRHTLLELKRFVLHMIWHDLGAWLRTRAALRQRGRPNRFRCLWPSPGMNESCHTYEWVMSHIWMSHVTHMNESCHTYEWVMSHIWMSHVTHMNESCHTYEWVMSYIWMSHVPHTNESCRTYEWVMAMNINQSYLTRKSCLTRMDEADQIGSHVSGLLQVWMSHVTLMKKSCHTYEWVMSHEHEWVMPHTYEGVLPHTHERGRPGLLQPPEKGEIALQTPRTSRLPDC